MIKTDFLKQLSKLNVVVHKRIASSYIGERQSVNTGKGLIFKDFISYAPGDDFRGIDWKLFARTDKLFSKRYEEDKNLTVHVVIDFSASMNFGSENILKSEFAGMLGLGFAHIALKNNEKFVLLGFSKDLEYFKPKRGRGQLIRVLDELNKKKSAGITKFADSMIKYKTNVNTKSLIVIISDFLSPINEIELILKRFRRHQIRLIQVLDPIEAQLNIQGDFKLTDSETRDQMRTYISPFLRKNYLSYLAEHTRQIKRACDSVGAEFFSFTTDRDLFDVFHDLLRRK